jgi:polyhydroxyalkanoate synthesis regulator phasin
MWKIIKEKKMLHNLLYTGIGAAALMKEKVEVEMKKLQEEGKIKTADAKSFLESIEQKGKDEEKRLKEELKSALKEVIEELGLATKEDLAKFKEECK